MTLKEEIRKAFTIDTDTVLIWVVGIGLFLTGLVFGMEM